MENFYVEKMKTNTFSHHRYSDGEKSWNFKMLVPQGLPNRVLLLIAQLETCVMKAKGQMPNYSVTGRDYLDQYLDTLTPS